MNFLDSPGKELGFLRAEPLGEGVAENVSNLLRRLERGGDIPPSVLL